MRMKRLAAVAAVALLASPLAAGAEGGWEMGSVAVMPTAAAGSAAVFHRYMSDVSTLNGQFRNAAGVADAVKRAAAYDPQQLQQGMVVFAAFTALRRPRMRSPTVQADSDGEPQTLRGHGRGRPAPPRATRDRSPHAPLHSSGPRVRWAMESHHRCHRIEGASRGIAASGWLGRSRGV